MDNGLIEILIWVGIFYGAYIWMGKAGGWLKENMTEEKADKAVCFVKRHFFNK